MWCRSAVDCSFLSFAATSRTRSSALCAPLRLCVRGAFCWREFSLASSLPSTSSAAAPWPALFGDFCGTTELSDFPCPFIIGVCIGLSPHGPRLHLPQAVPWDLPVLEQDLF